MRGVLRLLGVVLLGLGFTLLATGAAAGPNLRSGSAGDLDPGFGDGGRVTTVFTNDAASSGANALLLQPDGKILLAGAASQDSGTDGFMVMRRNADGSSDDSFGVDGTALPQIDAYAQQATALALQPDGKIVAAGNVAGSVTTGGLVVRFNPDGSMDTTFGTGGWRAIDIDENYNEMTAVAVQPDGKILVAGTLGVSYYATYVLVRLLPDGELDTSFAEDGIVTGSSDGFSFVVNRMALLPDGRIVLAGQSLYSIGLVRVNSDGTPDTSLDGDGRLDYYSDTDVLSANALGVSADGKMIVATGSGKFPSQLMRFNGDGSLDSTFGTAGVAPTGSALGDVQTRDLLIDSSGRIVVAGWVFISINGNAQADFAVARYKPDGSRDVSFGDGGVRGVDLGNRVNDLAYGLASGADGGITLAGWSVIASGYQVGMARYSEEGRPDQSFGSGGKLTFRARLPVNAVANVVLKQPDGKLLVVGDDDLFLSYHFVLARYEADGSLDPSFSGGRVETALGSVYAYAQAAALQSDGKIVVVGTDYHGFGRSGNADFAVVRYNSDGTLDSTFGGDGIVSTDMGGGIDYAESLSIQADGKIVVGGQTDYQGALLRFMPDGTLDQSFGNGGRFKYAVAGSISFALSGVVVQADGKILAIGSAQYEWGQYSTGYKLTILRLTAAGALDPAFGDGWVSSEGEFESHAVQQLPDGRVLVAGNTGGKLAVGRLLADGTLDNSFGSGGIAQADYGTAQGLAVDADGSVLAAGYRPYPRGSDFALARFKSDGTLDQAFGNGGMVIDDLNFSEQANGVVIDAAGRAVVVGYSGADREPQFTLLGYQLGGNCLYSDVCPSDYWFVPVQELARRGAISSYGDNTFRPYNNTTRGQLAKIVVLANAFPLVTPATATFGDVPTTDPFFSYVETAARAGIVGGYGDGSFRPYANVTRGQLSKIVALAEHWALGDPEQPTFGDVPRDNPFFGYVEAAYAHGVINGYADGTFRWTNNATRAQVAKIVYLAISPRK